MADKQISVRIVATGGDKMQAQFKAAGAAGTKAMNDIGRSASANRANVQNAAFQVQDFFVQVAAGTDPARAMAQQLPQLLGSMGLVGVLAGTAAAALIPLGAAFLGTGEKAQSAADLLREFEAAVAEVQRVNSTYSADGIQKLIDKYGELNSEVLLLIERQRQLRIDEAMEAARKAAGSLGAEFADLRADVEAYEELISTSGNNPILLSQAGLLADDIQERFGVTIDGARELLATLNEVNNGATLDEMANATSELYGLIEGTKLETSGLKDELSAAESALRELAAAAPAGGWMNAAISGVQALTGTLWEAVSANAALAQSNSVVRNGYTPDQVFKQQNDVYSGRGSDPRKFMNGGQFTPTPEVVKAADALLKPAMGGGGGGGGANDALREQNDLLREAEKVIESTRTAQEEYNDEVAKLDELLGQNLISQEVYDRALADLKEGLTDVKGAAEDMRESAKSAFADFVTGTKSAREALASWLEDLARAAAEQAAMALFGGDSPGGLLGGGLSKLLGGFLGLPSFDGGGSTGNGPRTGGLDGRGGFLAMLHPNETVTDHTRGLSSRSGGGLLRIEIVEADGFAAKTRSIASGVSTEHIKANNKRMPEIVNGVARDRRRR